ncbi:MAG: asparaginase [Erysipelotrichaceae bacterium]
MKKRILLIATGGTIACKSSENGLTPQMDGKELLQYVKEVQEYSIIDTVTLFFIDSTNINDYHWLKIAKTIEDNYQSYDGFVICHGTDTMAYTSCALSYLIQNNQKPIVITGSQKPINDIDTDGRRNLANSILFACDDRAYGVNIVFDGKVIAGTRAKKEYSKSFNAFSSINYPFVAIIQDNRIVFYIDDKATNSSEVKFYHRLNNKVFLLKLIPGCDGKIISTILNHYDGIIVESFGVGGFPDKDDHSFYKAIASAIKAGKIIVMATQVTHEGSDMAVYEVGKIIKENFNLIEAFDMTLEATVTKTMWALANSRDADQFRELFYSTINHDMLFQKKINNQPTD